MRVAVFAKPGRSVAKIELPTEFEREKCDLVVFVTSPPVDGKANKEIAKLLSERFGKPAILICGAKSRKKTFEIG